MTPIVLKMPMFRRDSSGQLRMVYAVYMGREHSVTEGEKSKYHTIRLLAVENRRGKQFLFRLAGNGVYGLYRLDDSRIAYGTMRDPVVPEIGPFKG